jgi:hypothetical protein
MVWFHPRDRHIHAGFGQGFVGTHAEAVAMATAKAGRSYTFTIKGASPHKPHTPDRRHSRPA